MRGLLTLVVSFGILSCAQKTFENNDPYLWLEEVEGEKALQWVESENKQSLGQITEGKRFKTLESEALAILQDKEKIPYVKSMNGKLYNFWQDEKHVRGVWRRTTLQSFQTRSPRWETVLDLDSLAKREKENWVIKEVKCLPPQFERCLINLSRGGKDAAVVREFDLKSKSFVKDGFYLAEAKSAVEWIDRDNIFVGTDFGDGSLTDSGYPRLVKVWKRGDGLLKAKEIYAGEQKDMAAEGVTLWSQQGAIHIVNRRPTFFTNEFWHYVNGQLLKLPLPEGAKLESYTQGRLLVELRKDWKVESLTFKGGSLLAVDPTIAGKSQVSANQVELIYQPQDNESFSYSLVKEGVLLNTLENVQGRIKLAKFQNGKFQQPVSLPLAKIGQHLQVVDSSAFESQFFYTVGDFLQPTRLNGYNTLTGKGRTFKTLSSRFNSKGMVVQQKWATSRDGTKVPYFLVGKSDVIKKGQAPTLLYGYGGFEVSLTPSYNSIVGKLWLEKGGLYVLANIRGGGEFGPRWHQAALKMNRQKAYDDFIAVGEDLVAQKVTNTEKLAIQGGSNGGLLVGAVMTQRPDLFRAVLCHVPLLDMIRFSQLLAGASWMGEYGNPSDPEEREFLLSISPYHNLSAEKKYPDLFLLTSTKDDRVHPGHARKMAAKMEDMGHKNVLYYENTEGGHAASANLKQSARMRAMTFEFLFRTINKG